MPAGAPDPDPESGPAVVSANASRDSDCDAVGGDAVGKLGGATLDKGIV